MKIGLDFSTEIPNFRVLINAVGFGCKDERLHVSVSIVDVVAASLIIGEKVKIGQKAHLRDENNSGGE